ncbi:MAG: esterase/lipase family protein [Spirochaetota bacterium]
MIKGLASTAIILGLFLSPATLMAGGDDASCATNYPIVLAHGMGATDDMLGVIDYWWGIEGALEDEGANVYVTAVNCMDSTASKALQFKQQYLQVLAVTGKAKANIIGHSHGTVYTRYAISNLGLAPKVASHTSMCGPHRGSAVADVLINVLPDAGEWLVGATLDVVYAFLLGDSSPDSLQNAYDVSRPFMNNVFNPNTPNISGVYYQSWATKIKTITPDLILEPTWLLLLFYEGANDGLVSINSAKWGTFRGTEEGAWWAGGVSHINAINHFFGITPGFDAPQFYVDIVSDLKNKGY